MCDVEGLYMYLISVYFDDESNRKLQQLINHVAEKTGNSFMSDNHVPPHMTVASIETKHEDEVLACLEQLVVEGSFEIGRCEQKTSLRMACTLDELEEKCEEVQWVSVGSFVPQVLYVQPVLNEYLHQMSCVLTEELGKIPETILSPYYQPFSWLPHCTIAKQLSKEQMLHGYEVLQNQFAPFSGRVTKIGIAKTNPHRDIRVWEI